MIYCLLNHQRRRCTSSIATPVLPGFLPALSVQYAIVHVFPYKYKTWIYRLFSSETTCTRRGFIVCFHQKLHRHELDLYYVDLLTLFSGKYWTWIYCLFSSGTTWRRRGFIACFHRKLRQEDVDLLSLQFGNYMYMSWNYMAWISWLFLSETNARGLSARYELEQNDVELLRVFNGEYLKLVYCACRGQTV